MSTATTARAEFLKTEDRFAVAESVTITTRWGEDAADTRQASVLDEEAAAAAEASRQMTLLATVRARDSVLVEGVHFDVEGKTVRLPYAGLMGAGATVDMLVVSARIDLNDGTTRLEGELVLP
jgi:hypothetical protein